MALYQWGTVSFKQLKDLETRVTIFKIDYKDKNMVKSLWAKSLKFRSSDNLLPCWDRVFYMFIEFIKQFVEIVWYGIDINHLKIKINHYLTSFNTRYAITC